MVRAGLAAWLLAATVAGLVVQQLPPNGARHHARQNRGHTTPNPIQRRSWRPTTPHRPSVSILVPATYQVTLELPDGERATIPCADDEFILDAAEEAGLDLPSSCRSGACTSCQGRVLAGAVTMDDQSTLDEEHIAVGYVCTCLAYPESDVTIKTHQMDNFENGVMEFDDAVAAAVVPPEETPTPAEVAPAAVVAAAPATPAPPAPPAPPTPTAAPAAPAPVVLDAYKADLALKTLAMLRDVVDGRADLLAKCDEFEALLAGGAPAARAAPAETTEQPSVETAEYVPYRCDAVGYTIWINKNNPRNSWYEYH